MNVGGGAAHLEPHINAGAAPNSRERRLELESTMKTHLKMLRDQSGRAGAAFVLWLLGAPAGIVLLALLARRC